MHTYRIEAAVCVDDTDDWPRQCILTVTKGFDENFAQEQRKVSISIGCQTLTKTACRCWYRNVEVVIRRSGALICRHDASGFSLDRLAQKPCLNTSICVVDVSHACGRSPQRSPQRTSSASQTADQPAALVQEVSRASCHPAWMA